MKFVLLKHNGEDVAVNKDTVVYSKRQVRYSFVF